MLTWYTWYERLELSSVRKNTDGIQIFINGKFSVASGLIIILNVSDVEFNRLISIGNWKNKTKQNEKYRYK